MSIKIKRKKMIYSDIEKIVLETPNDMELGKKIRELYTKIKAIEWDDEWDEYNRIVKENDEYNRIIKENDEYLLKRMMGTI